MTAADLELDLGGLTVAELRAAGPERLGHLARAARDLVVRSVAARGGHLGPNLGVVELTFALHRVFDSPEDVLLWDTGHQSYIHKVVTGRAERFASLRALGGLSGYPCRTESEHDWVENSHAGTSLSYAAGLATAFRLAPDGAGTRRRRVVAVIGDGALTAGMAMEALNDIADRGLDVVVVLNDNARSYAPTTGAVAQLLAELRADGRERSAAVLGCRYLGPVDGHDVAATERVLSTARDTTGPVIVHVVTRKGEGYAPAERDQVDHLHGVGPFDADTGTAAAGPAGRRPAGDVLNETLCELAAADDRVVVVAAAMTSASGLDPFTRRFPGRILDVGIAEQHAVTLAAGLAMAGMRPVVAIHATFLGRAFDQLLFDVGLHDLPVVFVADRAGITGGDGPSHHGLLDVALLRHVPGAAVATPSDAAEMAALLRAAVERSGPTLVRYHRNLPEGRPGAGPGELSAPHWAWDGTSGDVLLVAAGEMTAVSAAAAERLADAGLRVSRANARWLHPVDDRLAEVAAAHRLVVTVEDHCRAGGLGTAVLETLSDAGVHVPVVRCGVPVGYLPHGDVPSLRASSGLDPEAVTARVLAALDAGRS
nr:1-deoxy-D-xylulose-5-phosphate synthase [Dactylosporangium thailandense]